MVDIIALVIAVLVFIVVNMMTVVAFQDDGFGSFAAGTWLLGLCFTAVVLVGVDLAGTGIANATLTHHDHYRSVPLIALRDGSAQTSDYVLGSGGSDATMKYTFYWRDGDAERLVNVDASDIRLFEDSTKPYAVQFTGCDLSKPWIADCLNDAPSFTELHVPPGSVHSKFDLNLNSN